MAKSPVTFETYIFNIKYKTIYAFRRRLKRVLVNKLHLNRTNNYPYISGDGFRCLAQHVHDESSNVEPEKVQLGDLVFLNPDFIVDYFKNIHPRIQNKYILITHNSDLGIQENHLQYIDEKIAHWFAKNVLAGHEKITPIPIGLTNNFLNKIGKTSDMSLVRKIITNEKTAGISYGFSLASGSERIQLLEILKKHTLAVNVSEKTQGAYFKKMSTYSFVASPEGNGADCHRTWEALYLGCLPIVKKNYFIDHFKNMGIPMLTIDTWNEIEKLDDVMLNNIYNELKPALEHESLFMSYWIHLILSEKEKLFK